MAERHVPTPPGASMDVLYNQFEKLTVENGLGEGFLSHRLELQEGRKYRAVLDAIPALYRKNADIGDAAMDMFVDVLVKDKNYSGVFQALELFSYASDDVVNKMIEHRNSKYNEKWAIELFEAELNEFPGHSFTIAQEVARLVVSQHKNKHKMSFNYNDWKKRSLKSHDKYGDSILKLLPETLSRINKLDDGMDGEKSGLRRRIYGEVRSWLYHRHWERMKQSQTQGKLLSEFIMLASDLGLNASEELKKISYEGMYLFWLKRYLGPEAKSLLDKDRPK